MIQIPIINGIIGLGQTWLDGKNKKEAAKAEAEATVITAKATSEARARERLSETEAGWDLIMAKNSGDSWKDEYILIIWSAPFIMAFIPGMENTVSHGFKVLEQTPDWYQYGFSIILAGAYGVRKAIGFMKAKR